jgi:hypothetical protein
MVRTIGIIVFIFLSASGFFVASPEIVVLTCPALKPAASADVSDCECSGALGDTESRIRRDPNLRFSFEAGGTVASHPSFV